MQSLKEASANEVRCYAHVHSFIVVMTLTERSDSGERVLVLFQLRREHEERAND